MAEAPVRIQAGQAIEPFLIEGANLVLGPGVHRGGLFIEVSLTITGEDGAILDADRNGPVVLVEGDELKVTIHNVMLRGGAGEAGGGLRNTGRSEVSLSSCTFEDNEAALAGSGIGGGLWSGRGKVSLVDCRFSGNRSRSGSDVYLTNVAWLDVRGGDFAGDIFVGEGAKLDLTGARVRGKLSARGTTTRAPVITLRGAQVDAGIENDPNLPGQFVVEDG